MPSGRIEQPASEPGASRRTALLIMLMLIYALNYLDRQVVVILQEPIKHEYQLKDWQLGLLTGAAVSLFYTAMGLPIARWVDRGVNRMWLISSITALWSVMTAVCGVTQNYVQFLFARMGVGLAEAGYAPAAHSLISDLYAKRERPMAMGIFAMGIPLGIMLGLSLGGTIGQYYSWRVALMVVGLPGILVALLFQFISKEPARGAADHGPAGRPFAPVPFGEAMRTLMRIPAYVHILLGSTATTFAMAGITSWLPSLLIRTHGMSLAQVGLGLGLLSGVSGLAGAFFGGWQAGRLGRRGLQATLWLPILGLVLAIPLFVSAIQLGTPTTVLWMLLVPMTVSTLWSAPSIALKQTIAPLPLRATASALSIVAANVIGVALGPITTGLLSDVFGGVTGSSAAGLRWAMTVMALSLVWGIVHWILTVRALRRDFDAVAPAVAATA